MSDNNTAAAALLERLQYKGLHLSATAEGTLQVWPAVWLDESTREAIAEHKAGLVALLSAPAVDVLADDRRRCRDCYHLLRKGNCAMAVQGRLPGGTRQTRKFWCAATCSALCRTDHEHR